MFSDEVIKAIEKSALSMQKFSQKTKIKLRTLENWKAGKNEPDEFTKEAFRKIVKEKFPERGYTLIVTEKTRYCNEENTALTTYFEITDSQTANMINCIKIENSKIINYNEAVEYFEKKYSLKFDWEERIFKYTEE